MTQTYYKTMVYRKDTGPNSAKKTRRAIEREAQNIREQLGPDYDVVIMKSDSNQAAPNTPS